VQLAGDAEARGEEYMAAEPYTGSLIVHQRLETTHPEPRFRALLTGGACEVELALV